MLKLLNKSMTAKVLRGISRLFRYQNNNKSQLSLNLPLKCWQHQERIKNSVNGKNLPNKRN